MTRVKLTAVVRYAFAAALVSAVALSSDASARQQQRRAQEARSPSAAARDTQPQRAGGADENADLSITARVTAAEVRFEKVPNTRVDFTGKPERVTVWEAERENLPPQVQPGVTYRNVGITLRITSVFADIDRIVAEALGEVPAGDGAQPAPAQPPATPPARPSDAPPAPTTAPPASPSPSGTSPANSVTNAPRRRPAQRGRGK